MYKIGVLPGDGIGKEIVDEGLKVLRVCSERFGFQYETIDYPYGADHYLETGDVLPSSALEEMKGHDAVLLGAIGDPRCEVGFLERGIIAGVRFGLDLFINLRPIKLYSEHLCPLKNRGPEDVDMVVVRENTEGAYSQVFGFLRKGTPNELSTQTIINTRMGAERACRYAFELCRARNRQNRVTLVDKANALRSQDLWSRVFAEVGEEYPEIEKDHAYIDAACMWMIKNPDWFDVLVTPNLMGDIITDVGAMIQGGLGVAAGGNIHPGQVSCFEPIHGSAPKYQGKNVASPIATIAAVQMMLDHLGQGEAATAIEHAIESLLVSQRIPDLSARSGISTIAQGDMVAEALLAVGSPD